MPYIALVPAIHVNVKQYGAVGDGISDDSTFIANALAAAQSLGAPVWFPPSTGDYITSTITGYPGMSLLGSNNGNFSQNVPASNRSALKLKPGTNGPLIDIPANISNIRLRDLELDGNSANQTGGTTFGVVHFEDNTTVGDESQSIIERCSIHHGYGHNIYLGKGRRGNFLRDNLITWSLNGDGVLIATSDTTISGGFIGDSGRNGIGVGSTNTQLYSASGNPAAVTIIDGIGIFKSGQTTPGAAIAVSAFSSMTMISNCGMDRNRYNAVSVYDGSTTKIVNCSFHSNYASANNAGGHIDLASGVVKVVLDDNSFGPQDGDTPNLTSYGVTMASASTVILGNIGNQNAGDSVNGLINSTTALHTLSTFGAEVQGNGGNILELHTASNALVGKSDLNGLWSAPALIASGLTGATAASRYVGATTSGAPTSGTFAIGDFIIDQVGTVWVCTAAGTPGTWASANPISMANQLYGYLGWAFDPAIANGGAALGAAGTITLCKIHWPSKQNVTNIVAGVSTGGTLTAGQCFAGIYNSSGTLLGTTADQSGVWNAAGTAPKIMPITGGPISVPGGGSNGWIYVALLWNGTASPQFYKATNGASALFNGSLSAATLRNAINSSAQTTLPASLTLSTSTASANLFWVALS